MMKALKFSFPTILSILLFYSGSAQFSSNLPIVIINTGGNTIPDEPKIEVTMGIIYNGVGATNNSTDPHNHYNGKIGIEQRGSSSYWFPQKSYSFETRNPDGTNLDTALLGMPSENDWVLHAPYTDKSLLRNVLSYQLWNEMGHYGPRTRFVELILNNQYQGVYVLVEKIKKDNNRVDIADLMPTDISGDELTGGYIVKVDKTTAGGTGWVSPHLSPAPANMPINILFHYPESDEIVSQQATYIQNFVTAMENNLAGANFTNPTTGYRMFLSINSFIDYLILNEISKNVDGYRISAFFNKDKSSKGGKFKAGPAWDYNIAWWNADYCAGDSYTGWAYDFPSTCPGDGYQVPFWWSRLMQDPYFVERVRCRYEELRTNVLDITKLNNYIDAYVFDTLSGPQVRHFNKWPILGTYLWPNPNTPPAYSSGADNEIKNLKTWITNRLTWMDANLPGTCTTLPANLISFTGKREGEQVALKWESASEYNLQKYVVEYSLDGTNTEEVGEVLARNRSSRQSYSLDLDFPNTAIFRLKMVDLDGSLDYSEWVSVSGAALLFADFETYPNPVTDKVMFAFRVNKPTDVSIQLLNATGTLVREMALPALPPGGYTRSFEQLYDLPSGTYLIKISSGQTVLCKKFMK